MALTNAEQYVKAHRDAQAIYAILTAEERAQAAEGIRWLEITGHMCVGPKRRGRPPGSKTRRTPVEQQSIAAVMDSAAIPITKEA